VSELLLTLIVKWFETPPLRGFSFENSSPPWRGGFVRIQNETTGVGKKKAPLKSGAT